MLKWFREHTKLAIVLAVLLALLLILVASFLHMGNNSPLGRAAESGIAILQKPADKAGDGLASAFGFLKYRSLMKENQALQEEVEALQKELRAQTLSAENLEELRALSSALNYQAQEENFSYVTADVIAMDGSRWFNLFTIDRGSNDGIQQNDVVVCGAGLVGKVYDVGAGWAKVISIIDQNNNVSFKVFRDSTLLGILCGDGDGKLTGYLLDTEASVVEGDVLMTSGLELYPAGIEIGVVTKVEWDADSMTYVIQAEPSAYFKNIQKVTVLAGTGK